MSETGRKTQKRPESLSGGARNGCYGKSASQTGTKKPRRAFLYLIDLHTLQPSGLPADLAG